MKVCEWLQVDDLEEYINDPVKQHYLVRSLPARMKRQLLYRRCPSFLSSVSVFAAVNFNLPLYLFIIPGSTSLLFMRTSRSWSIWVCCTLLPQRSSKRKTRFAAAHCFIIIMTGNFR